MSVSKNDKKPEILTKQKNNNDPPEITDERVKWVPIGCGNCMECRKQKKREWQIRMNEEIKHDRTGKFITLTFSNEELDKLIQETGIQESNAVATIAVRRFLERWRKKYKKSVKHFLITAIVATALLSCIPVSCINLSSSSLLNVSVINFPFLS